MARKVRTARPNITAPHLLNAGNVMRRIYCILISAAVLLLIGCAATGNVGSDTTAQACAGLAGHQTAPERIGLPTRGAIVTAASLIAKASTTVEYCRVEGSIASVDPAAQPIKFAMALPTNWNKKLMQHGGGGWNGVVVDPAGRGAGTSGAVSLQRGYVVIGSDSGHTANPRDASFILNAEQFRNFATDQLKKTHDVAVEIIATRYGSTPQKTYFMGGSEGGRESMVLVQRFPNDYDGVFTLYPVFNWVSSFTRWQLIARSMRLNAGAGWISPAKLEVLRKAELAACDKLDGVEDGLISNVNACHFDPQVLVCPEGTDQGQTCLSKSQVNTVRLMNAPESLPYPLANGYTSVPNYYPGTYWGANLGTSASFTDPSDSTGLGLISLWGDVWGRWLANRSTTAQSLPLDPMTIKGSELENVQNASALLDMTSTDISAFMARGGKWIMVHGLSDPLPPASGTVGYYKSLVAKYGQVNLDKTLRFYTIPGFAHGNGPFNAAGGMPIIEALESWVERDLAPSTLEVASTNEGSFRTRPLCVFPGWPKYKGSGDVNSAISFECATE